MKTLILVGVIALAAVPAVAQQSPEEISGSAARAAMAATRTLSDLAGQIDTDQRNLVMLSQKLQGPQSHLVETPLGKFACVYAQGGSIKVDKGGQPYTVIANQNPQNCPKAP